MTDALPAAGGWFAAADRSVVRAVGSARAAVGDGDLHMQLEASAGLTRIASTGCIMFGKSLCSSTRVASLVTTLLVQLTHSPDVGVM